MKRLNDKDPVVNVAVFGKQVEAFLESDIGVYLLSKTQEEEEQATERLINNAHTLAIKDILAEQATITRARNFRDWLAYAIQDGLQALQMLEEQQ
jgi:hypothetical protein